MRKLFIAALVCMPLLADQSNPLHVRFPAAQALEKHAEQANQMAEQARRAITKAKQLALQQKMPVLIDISRCAHIRIVTPSPAVDPRIVAGPPQDFKSNMPVMKGIPACSPDAR